jgi:hypothetical protein
MRCQNINIGKHSDTHKLLIKFHLFTVALMIVVLASQQYSNVKCLQGQSLIIE